MELCQWLSNSLASQVFLLGRCGCMLNTKKKKRTSIYQNIHKEMRQTKGNNEIARTNSLLFLYSDVNINMSR